MPKSTDIMWMYSEALQVNASVTRLKSTVLWKKCVFCCHWLAFDNSISEPWTATSTSFKSTFAATMEIWSLWCHKGHGYSHQPTLSLPVASTDAPMWTYICAPDTVHSVTFRADGSRELMFAVRRVRVSGNKWPLLPTAAATAGSLWQPRLCPRPQLGEGPAELQSFAGS